jgi:hypothetical protein
LLKVLNDLAALSDAPDRAAFAELDKRAQEYDPEILKVVRSCFLDESAAGDDAPGDEVVQVSAVSLLAGARLVSNIETEDGTLVLAAGNEVSQAHIEHLRNFRRYRKLKEPIHVVQPAPASRKGSKARS